MEVMAADVLPVPGENESALPSADHANDVPAWLLLKLIVAEVPEQIV